MKMNNWVLKENDSKLVKEYALKLGISPFLADIFISRGFSIEESFNILNANHKFVKSPKILTNAVKAAKKIYDAILENKKIRVFSDYDVDGLTSGLIIKESVLECKEDTDIKVYYPNRSEGYGLNMNWCEKIVEEDKDKNTLVVTVDNGITQVREVEYLLNNNVDVLITDHHESKDIVPDCLIVNPHNNHEEQDEDTKGLCGCGVIFKVMQIVQAKFNIFNMLNYAPYLALATIADVMPMTNENIAFVNYGLSIINSDKCPLALRKFKEYKNRKVFNSEDLGFLVSPVLNACGRIDDIYRAVDFLEETNPFSIEDKFINVLKANDIRKKYEKEVIKGIDLKDIEKSKLVVISTDQCPIGVLGVIANKVVREYKKPCIVLKKEGDIYKGSARSLNNIDILKTIEKIDEKTDIINSYGGHKMALGIEIKEDSLEEFKSLVNEYVVVDDEEDENINYIDSKIDICNINMNTVNLLNILPFNNKDLPKPVLALDRVTVKKTKLSSKNKKNILFTLSDKTGTIDIWAWGFGPRYLIDLKEKKEVTIIGHIERNFMNPKYATMRVIDII